jgi:hypothetical protein
MVKDVRSARQAAILRYFELADAGQFPADLFTEDFEFFVPKFGVGHGAAELSDMAKNFGVTRIRHPVESMLFIESGDNVAVEGTTEGTTASGTEWAGGRTSAGRFASIFAFDDAGLIRRMYVYADPDFDGSHAAGFRWNRGAAQAW